MEPRKCKTKNKDSDKLEKKQSCHNKEMGRVLKN